VTLWIWLRAAGVGGYVALWLSVVWGLISSTGLVTKRVSKPTGNHFHAVIASTGLALIGIHTTLLVFHEYMPFGLWDVLIPRRDPYRPVAIALGILAMYMAVFVTVSSWLRTRVSTGLWRGIHLLAVPAFILSLLHGVYGGTDTERPWMVALYAASGLLVLLLVLVRALSYGYRPPRPAPPEHAATGRATRPAASATG
jgi:methionine sulfoxide reductase heme-binding subunit